MPLCNKPNPVRLLSFSVFELRFLITFLPEDEQSLILFEASGPFHCSLFHPLLNLFTVDNGTLDYHYIFQHDCRQSSNPEHPRMTGNQFLPILIVDDFLQVKTWAINYILISPCCADPSSLATHPSSTPPSPCPGNA